MSGEAQSLTWELIRAVLILLLLIPLAYLATRAYAKRTHGGGRSGVLRIVEVVPLGTGRSLVLVDLAGHLLLLGVTAQQIQLLTEISSDDEAYTVLDKVARGKDETGIFKSILKQKFERESGQGEGDS